MQEIFAHDSLSGKELRLVSKLWNEVVLSSPKPKFYLKLNQRKKQACCNRGIFLDTLYLTLSSPKLTRWVDLGPGCDLGQQPDEKDHPLTDVELISTVSRKYSENIEMLRICSYVAVRPALYRALAEGCPNLKYLRVLCPLRGDQEAPTLPNFDPILPLKIALEHVLFVLFDHVQLTFCQKVLNSAPNLKILQLSGNLYPDLGKNTKLARLEYVGLGPAHSGGAHFNGPALARLISQVKDSLKSLSIFVNPGGWQSSVQEEFSLPETMPNLRVFSNFSVDILPSNDQVGGLFGLANCTNLRKISLGGSRVCGAGYVEKLVQILYRSNVPLGSGV